MTTIASSTDRQIAVLVDVENVGLSSIQWLFDQLADIGRIIVKRAYGDWSVAGNKRDQLLELGIEAIQVFHATPSGKNTSDIRLGIDAVDLLYQSTVDTFVIVSADSDFVPLVSRLRAAGKMVIGAGDKKNAPHSLVISCDRYYYLEKQAKPRARVHKGKGRSSDVLLTRAVEATMDEQGRVVGSKLHQALQRLDPSFSFRVLGHSTFTRYLEASPGVKVTRPGGAGDVTVELAETATVPAPAPVPEVTDTGWDVRIDAAWSKRAAASGDRIPGPNAAGDAAKFLGVSKLSASRYRTLQALLDASELLSGKWRRDGNTVIRR
ncbi:MAG TPA: NYN domain-containing protein [Dehalococcoidales bacterium]|nr:NYN domain-containing protein [Dehalococcoidales bacterium]